MLRKNKIFSVVVAGALGAVSTCWADEPQQKEKPELKLNGVVVTEDSDDKKTVQLGELAPNKLWLGVGLKNVEGDLSEFLGSDKGVLVEDVQDNSPAVKAGIRKGDLLLSVNGTELDDPADLMKFMQSAKEGEALKIKLRRKNEEMEIKVTPEPRPRDLKFFMDLSKEDIGDRDFQFHFDPEKMELFRMGSPAGIFIPQGLPKGDLQLSFSSNKDGKSIEVKVDRKGENPAQITITKDGETKTYSEDQLDEIPEELRSWISSMIKPGNRSIFGLSQMGDLRKLEKLQLETDHLKSHLEALMKDKKFSKSEIEAVQRALETATALNKPELHKQMDDIRSKVTAEAKEAIAKAAAKADSVARSAKKSENKEVEELRQLVNELRKEIAELRDATKKERSDK